MKCEKCKNEAYFNGLCKSCFSRYVERKIRREIRTNQLINKNDTLVINDPLCQHIIGRIINMPIKLIKKGKGKKVLPWTIENETHYFLSLFLKNKPLKNLGHEKEIKLLLCLREDEAAAFAKIKKLPFKKINKDYITKAMDNLEKKHPQTKYSLMRSINDIKKAIK